DRAVARLVDAAQLLHDRRGQPDLVARDLAAPRPLNCFERGADRVSLGQVHRHQLGRQNIDLSALAEQRGNALGLLPGIELGQRLCLQICLQRLRSSRRMILPVAVSGNSSTNTTSRGAWYQASRCPTNERISSAS